ncbi:RNA polymerase sigma factor, partial [Dysosmobacter welbionis]
GHLHHPVLPVRPDLRVPGHQPGRGGQVLHQHSQPGGGHRPGGDRGGRGVEPQPGLRSPGPGLRLHAGLHRHSQAAVRPGQGGPHVQPPDHPAAAEGRPG